MTLDGERNEVRPEVDRRYGVVVDALLEGVLYHDKYPMYAMSKNWGTFYIVGLPQDAEHQKELSISIRRLDKEFSAGVRILLAELEHRHQQGLKDNLYDRLQECLLSRTQFHHRLPSTIGRRPRAARAPASARMLIVLSITPAFSLVNAQQPRGG